MKYFKVKKSADNVRKSGAVNNTDVLVKNELYTEKELLKFAPKIHGGHSLFTVAHFDVVNIPKNDTYFSFGARFCNQYPYNS